MKTPLLWLVLAVSAASGFAASLGSAFTYQGRLTDAGSPASGEYDFQFLLHDAEAGGNPASATRTNENVLVTNGVFTTALDFGTNVFNGAALWLEIAVRPGNSSDAFTLIHPRQPITATPYALRALNFVGALSDAQLVGIYGNAVTISNAANKFGGKFSGNGGELTNLNAASVVGPLSAAALTNAWRIGGNAGISEANNFIGTTDNKPLEFRVNNSRALRLQPDTSPANAPNVIGGSPVNVIGLGVVGTTIAGGGSADYEGNGPAPNTVGLSYGTVGGGVGNDTAGVGATIGGGYNNTSIGFFATVAGGGVNRAHGDYTSLGGGLFNEATNTASTVAGGRNNRAFGRYSSVGGGTNVQALGEFSTVGGGYRNESRGGFSTIAGGISNVSSGVFASLGGGNGNAATNTASTVSGGTRNHAYGAFSTIGGGTNNVASDIYSTVAGGTDNLSSDFGSTVGGGSGNISSSGFATVAGGADNIASHVGSTVGGGTANESTAQASVVSGGQANTASGSFSMVAGGSGNEANGRHSFAAGFRAQAEHNGA
ncbi:MAG TPA: hypothetical protein VK530_11955, partial [Candidatus Acidoferrum sp.]|nr:hypothetical protein [Candidatus Acidoferrum sp.]